MATIAVTNWGLRAEAFGGSFRITWSISELGTRLWPLSLTVEQL
jgi:hypothetical protein